MKVDSDALLVMALFSIIGAAAMLITVNSIPEMSVVCMAIGCVCAGLLLLSIAFNLFIPKLLRSVEREETDTFDMTLVELQIEFDRTVAQIAALEGVPTNVPLPDEFPQMIACLEDRLLELALQIDRAERQGQPS